MYLYPLHVLQYFLFYVINVMNLKYSPEPSTISFPIHLKIIKMFFFI